jgi:hypothetical protein
MDRRVAVDDRRSGWSQRSSQVSSPTLAMMVRTAKAMSVPISSTLGTAPAWRVRRVWKATMASGMTHARPMSTFPTRIQKTIQG